MPNSLPRVFDDTPRGEITKVSGIYALLIGFNFFAWAWALVAFLDRPGLLATALLAYILGLRHAVDADHIAAIDNVVRKLMQEGRRPHSVGFFFALGHSTVVVLATAAVAVMTTTLQDRFAALRETGGMIGTGVSAFFLLTIALVNLVIQRSVWASFGHVRRGGKLEAEHFDMLLAGRGFLAKLFAPLFRLIGKSWHM